MVNNRGNNKKMLCTLSVYSETQFSRTFGLKKLELKILRMSKTRKKAIIITSNKYNFLLIIDVGNNPKNIPFI